MDGHQKTVTYGLLRGGRVVRLRPHGLNAEEMVKAHALADALFRYGISGGTMEDLLAPRQMDLPV